MKSGVRSQESGVRSQERKRANARQIVPTPNSEHPALARALVNAGRRLRTLNSRGFTLIELTVVIVVLGIMLSLIIPRLGELGEANLKRSARHLTGMIRFLHDEAQAKKEMFRLRFDVPEGRYWVEVWTVLSLSDKTAEFKRFSSEMATEGTLSGETSFRDVTVASHPDDPYIEFSPEGWVERALIHLRDGEGRDFTLMVNPLTGDTEFREGYLEEK